jgi:Zn-dependent peptidase ImmA (M78 family)
LFNFFVIKIGFYFLLDKLSETNKRIEVFCNAFSGKFLVPDAAFDRYLDKKVNDAVLEEFL